MEPYLIYIGKAALAAGAFYLVFLALFQNRKQFTFNRIYLPVSLALSFAIPLITFTTVNYLEPLPVESTPLPVFTESFEPVVRQQSQPQLIWEWYHYLFAIYAAGTALFLVRLLLGHGKAWSIIRKSRVQELFDSLVNVSKKDIHPFSFFSKIVLSEKTLSSPHLKIIVQHEKIHVKEKHTLDILFTEILFLLQWFNPFVWLLKDAVKNNLEYKTDHEIAKINNAQTYQLAMLALADKQGVAPFLTALNGSQLKSRIIMMKKKTQNKYAWLKQLVILPLLAVLVMGLAEREVRTEFINPDKKVEIHVNGKAISTNHENLRNLNLSKSIDTKQIIKALHLENVKATRLEESADISKLYIRTGDYLPENMKLEVYLNGELIPPTNPNLKKIDLTKPINRNEIINELNIDDVLVTSMQNNVDGYSFYVKTKDYKSGENKEFEKAIPHLRSLFNISNITFSIKKTSNEKSLNQTKNGNQNELAAYIRGKVTNEKGEPIIGATIAEFDQKGRVIHGTISNDKGQFVIKLKQELKDAIVKCSHPGYKTQLIHLEEDKLILIILKSENSAPDKQEEKSTTPEYDTIQKSKTRESKNIRGLDNDHRTLPAPLKKEQKFQNQNEIKDQATSKKYKTRLADKVNGVHLGNHDDPSQMPLFIIDGIEKESMDDLHPGDILSVEILKDKAVEMYGEKAKDGAVIITTKNNLNGASIKNTIQGKVTNEKGELIVGANSNEPLYFVDGKITKSITQIPPEDIERIDFLKDKSATDLYGPNAQNGVILITTKSKSYSYLNDDAQVVRPKPKEDFVLPEVLPEFPGGEEALKQYIDNNINYPETSREKGIQGKAYVSFKITKEGKVTNVRLARGVYPPLDQEAIRVVSSMPEWKPAMTDGRPVDMPGMAVPVDFVIKNPVVKVKSYAQSLVIPGPLYIVDGEETRSIKDVPPEDIKHISVLKSPSSTALYGQRGKDGVIIITTRKGAPENKLITELQLRKFIAEHIKYPVEAQRSGLQGMVSMVVDPGKSNQIVARENYSWKDVYELGWVVVTGSGGDTPSSDNPEKNSPLLYNELERVLQMLPEVDIPTIDSKLIRLNVEFKLQSKD